METHPAREFRLFAFRDAHYRINAPAFPYASRRIRQLRNRLEEYIRQVPSFASSFSPLPFLPGSPPDIAVRMHRASILTGTGPMAAVAGAFAQEAAEAAIMMGVEEAVVDNGGDLFCIPRRAVTIGLYTGKADRKSRAGSSPFSSLGLRILPEDAPLAICSSSSTMGHSISLGRADLVTVISSSGALADGAATMGANLTGKSTPIDTVAQEVLNIEGVLGVLIFHGSSLAKAGWVPELVRTSNPETALKVVRAPDSNFPG